MKNQKVEENEKKRQDLLERERLKERYI